MATGMVKWFNDAKGLWFQHADDGEEELFADFSARADELKSPKEARKSA